MKTLKLFLSICLAMTFSLSAFAQGEYSVFETMHELEVPEIKVPTIAQFSLTTLQEYPVVVVEKESQTPVYSQMNTEYNPQDISFEVTESSAVIGNPDRLFDGDFDNAVEFDLDKDRGSAFIVFETDREVELSSFSLYLDKNVSLPYSVSVDVFIDGKWKTALANEFLPYFKIGFPAYTSNKWRLEFKHSQPLRIKEIAPYLEDKNVSFGGHEIKFLAKPDSEYLLYSDAATSPGISYEQKPNLKIGEEDEVVEAQIISSEENKTFEHPDVDGDGIADYKDNCVNLANEDQEDLDENGKGDACEDHDRDGVLNANDNCPNETNRLQEDTDGDGIGDACDDEESRVTENLPWLPWLALIIALAVIGIISFQTFKSNKSK